MNGYELTGERFGRLAVLRYSHSNKNKQRIWECQCDCGNIIFASSKPTCKWKHEKLWVLTERNC